MKVTARSWPADADSKIYSSASSLKTGKAKEDRSSDKEALSSEKDREAERLLDSLKALSASSSKESGSNFKMKASKPEDSVGQLAAMLARAETRIDVQQVASRAIRALTSLKMTQAASQGSDAKKIAQMIKRMEKLIKRIQKKLQHLSKEEQLENQRKRAEKKNEIQRAKEIQEELNTRRKKRRRDEKNYANKEMAEDAKNSAAELNSELANAISPGSPGGSPAASVSDMSGFSADMSVGEGVSIDISV